MSRDSKTVPGGARGAAPVAPHEVAPVVVERRRAPERRRRLLHSLLHGGIWPRRVSGRRAEDRHRPVIDWHGPGLMTSALLVLLMCVADAALTLTLLARGATEANPVMALFVYTDVRTFTILKLALTGVGVLVLVAVARFEVFGVMRVATLLHVVLVGYGALIGYEVWLLHELA